MTSQLKHYFWPAQILTLIALGLGYWMTPSTAKVSMTQEITGAISTPKVELPRDTALEMTPLYDRPEMISDAELARVLTKVQPRFADIKRRPNLVEHALRAWSVEATFQDPAIMSGEKMRDFLLDHSNYYAEWGDETAPLLMDRPEGIAIRWASDRSASVHHDHLLACLAEAKVPLTQPVYAPSKRNMTLEQVLLESLRDFDPDERETEWSALAYTLWLAPNSGWVDGKGREVSFDLLAKRLIRGHLEKGVCSGTHRVYSLMVMYRVNQEYPILSEAMAAEVYSHLEHIRDLISVSQFEDGHWPSNWGEGAYALENPKQDKLSSQVIATGHHLEWLAIAPEELHPPKQMMEKAADWLVKTTDDLSQKQVLDNYTFFSHVGNALALWRKTTPSQFWSQWETEHPFEPAEITAK